MNTVIDKNPLEELDLYIGCDGWLTLDLYENEGDNRTFNTMAIEPETLVKEYVRKHWNPDENRIANRESGCLIDLIDSFKRCVTILEQAVYEDKPVDD